MVIAIVSLFQTVLEMWREEDDNDYLSHEENGIKNMAHASTLATFVNQSVTFLVSYIHESKKGAAACFCTFGSGIASFNRIHLILHCSSISPLSEVASITLHEVLKAALVAVSIAVISLMLFLASKGGEF